MRTFTIATPQRNPRDAFTLIELAIVLTIIGFIVGSVLVGQDLVGAAGVRAQIAQIEKYNTAVNAFRDKYNGQLPGDIDSVSANTFGFAARGTHAGQGDSDGFIQGWSGGVTASIYQSAGETVMFWSDLTYANGKNLGMIEGNFSAASSTVVPSGGIPSTQISSYFPAAKIGQGNYVYVWAAMLSPSAYPQFYCPGCAPSASDYTTANYFGLSAISYIDSTQKIISSTGLTVKQAYQIDTKMDDGMPLNGKTRAVYLNNSGGGTFLAYANGPAVGTYQVSYAIAGTTTSCFDNNSKTGSAIMQYSITMNYGTGMNCALSFQFQ